MFSFSSKIIGTVLPKDLFEFVVSLWAYWDLQRSSPKVELEGILCRECHIQMCEQRQSSTEEQGI